jgi:hypothetical protein
MTSLTAASPSDRQCGSLVESSLAHYIWIPLFIQTVLIAAKLAHSWMAAKRQLGVSFIFPMYFWFLVLLCPFWSKRSMGEREEGSLSVVHHHPIQLCDPSCCMCCPSTRFGPAICSCAQWSRWCRRFARALRFSSAKRASVATRFGAPSFCRCCGVWRKSPSQSVRLTKLAVFCPFPLFVF